MMRRLQGGYYTDVRRKCCNTFYGRSCWANLFAYLLEVPLAKRIIRCVIPRWAKKQVYEEPAPTHYQHFSHK